MHESWHAVTIDLATDDVELAGHILHEAGCNGVAEELPREGGRTKIVAYFDASNEGADHLKARIKGDFAPFQTLAGASIEIVTAGHNEWREGWRQWFKPFEIVPNIIVAPSWERYEAKPCEGVIVLDPGMAFGTGLHETTRLCAMALYGLSIDRKRTVEAKTGPMDDGRPLASLARTLDVKPLRPTSHVLRPASLLDVGTGSGLLALVGRKLGVERIAAIENDPDALSAAVDNFKINGAGDIEALGSLSHAGGTFDIVVANILLLTLIELKNELIARVSPGGSLILSGITKDQEERLMSAFSPPLSFESKTEMGEWAAVVFKN